MFPRFLSALVILAAGRAAVGFAQGDLPPAAPSEIKPSRPAHWNGSRWPTTPALPPMPKPAPKYRWERVENESLTLVGPSGIVWRFNYGPKLTKPYFHPLQTVDGRNLSWISPADHPWHYGLWHSWKFIDGVNYWEEDPQTGRAAGTTRIIAAEVRRSDEAGADIHLRLGYHPAGQPDAIVLEDTLELVIETPHEDGTYRIFWTQTSRARHPVVLDRTPPPDQPDGKSYGGYGGLSFRGDRFLTGAAFISSTGQTDMAVHRQPAEWVALTAMADGRPLALAMFDHPSNLRHPTPWFLGLKRNLPRNDNAPFWFVNAALLNDRPLPISPEQPLTLRYLVRIDNDSPPPASLADEFRRFAASAFRPAEIKP